MTITTGSASGSLNASAATTVASGRVDSGPFDSGPFDTDVLILGAGPVGLTLANLLGGYGITTTFADAGEKLIDYPRGVGLDDDGIRTALPSVSASHPFPA